MTDKPQANIIQHFEPDGTMWYECGWHHLPMPDNRCPKCDSYPSYEAMRADLPPEQRIRYFGGGAAV